MIKKILVANCGDADADAVLFAKLRLVPFAGEEPVRMAEAAE